MERWHAFSYREFYDVPRMLVVEMRSSILLLVSRFDANQDDYESLYHCYRLPIGVDLRGTWEGIERSADHYFGSVAVSQVRFDQSKRQKIDLSSLSLPIAE
jgi:hypothetical protein